MPLCRRNKMNYLSSFKKSFSELNIGDFFVALGSLSLGVKINEHTYYDITQYKIYGDDINATVLYIGKLEDHLKW